jgi:hypothetical protein
MKAPFKGPLMSYAHTGWVHGVAGVVVEATTEVLGDGLAVGEVVSVFESVTVVTIVLVIVFEVFESVFSSAKCVG